MFLSNPGSGSTLIFAYSNTGDAASRTGVRPALASSWSSIKFANSRATVLRIRYSDLPSCWDRFLGTTDRRSRQVLLGFRHGSQRLPHFLRKVTRARSPARIVHGLIFLFASHVRASNIGLRLQHRTRVACAINFAFRSEQRCTCCHVRCPRWISSSV